MGFDGLVLSSGCLCGVRLLIWEVSLFKVAR